ncbi:MAG: hypothetical protein FIB01_13675 [Gemmatimonadetes bacterium]|nr:hypothetical protein [Gemmatimonadota bacterium]
MAERELTGNHYLSIPDIEHDGAVIPRLTALHSALAGLLVWSGDPLLRPVLEVDGESVLLADLEWERLDRWIPQARTRRLDCEITLTVCAPAGYAPPIRGAVIDIRIHNTSASARRARAALAGRWRGTDLHLRTGRPLPGVPRLAGCAGLPGVALEAGLVPFGAALAVGGANDEVQVLAGREGTEPVARAGDWECTADGGAALIANLVQEGELPAGRTVRFSFFLGLGRDRDGALATVAQLARLGGEGLLRRGRLALSQLVRKADDPGLNELLNRNLLFNHFFALGRGLDDDRLHAVSSRSPQHGSTAVCNEREVLFWTLPAVTLCDPFLARELLIRVIETFSGAAGQPARYLDGGIMAPGFVLDQLLAYPLALARYAREAQDESIIEDGLVQDVLREVDGALYDHLHREVLLAETELLSPGELADYPYPTFGNVLLWAYARALPQIWQGEKGESPASFAGAADEVAAAIWQHCTVDVDGVPVLASATNLTGDAAVYDDPTASLVLLPWLGFCPPEDPIWRNTMELFHSADYPLWQGAAPYPGMAGRRTAGRAALAALAAELLGPGRDRALRTLQALQLTDGVAADEYDVSSGHTAAGPHAAALAGFLAWSLDRGAAADARPKRKQVKR